MKPAAFLLLLVMAGNVRSAGPVVAPRGSSVTQVIELRNFEFAPPRVEVFTGDTVVWVNRDAAPHTATDSLGRWDSGNLASGERWVWVAREAGAYGVVCRYHPAMRGALVVRAPRGLVSQLR